MEEHRSLFDSLAPEKEDRVLKNLKDLDEKISGAIERVRTLKGEKAALEQTIGEMKDVLHLKNAELEMLRGEKHSIKSQIEELLQELEPYELN